MAPPPREDISLFKLFQMMGLENNIQVKMYRHIDHDVRGYAAVAEDIYSSGNIEQFQSFQGKHILGKGFLASFIGEQNRLSRFVGIWKIVDHGQGNAIANTSRDLEFSDYVSDSTHWYKMTKDTRFNDLIDRLVIQWPVGRIAHRWLIQNNGFVENFAVHSIRAKGLSRPFPGFGNLQLTYNELCQLNKDGDGGNGWIEALRSTWGVYLISDIETGGLYVGSATGVEGFFGRWKEYAKSVHGGNIILKGVFGFG